MKRLIIGIFIVGLIVPLTYFIYKKLSQTNTDQQAQIPPGTPFKEEDREALQRLIENCYRWYVPIYASDQNINKDTLPEREMRHCFSNDFIASWAATDTGGDPVLLAQDHFESWRSDFAFDFISEKDGEGYVKVTLGSGTESHVILVQARKGDAEWKIAAVRFP